MTAELVCNYLLVIGAICAGLFLVGALLNALLSFTNPARPDAEAIAQAELRRTLTAPRDEVER